VAVLIALVAVPTFLSAGGPLAPVAQAVTTRTGNLWTVAPGASAEIQPAIDSARDNGGGRVRLPAAVYLLTTKIRLHNNVTLYGDGIDQTILRWASSNAPDHMMSNGALTDGNANIQVWGLTLDGQRKPSGRSDCCFGLRLNNIQNSMVVNVAADGHSLDGIYIGYNRQNGAHNVRLSGCRANSNARNGISLIHGDSNVIDGCTVNGNNLGEAVAGIDVEPDEGLSVTNSRIVNNTANGQNVGIQIFLPFNGYATTYHNAVCYNTTTGNVSAGIYSFRGDQNIFVQNATSGNGTNYSVDDSSLEGPAYASWCTLPALPPHPSTLDLATSTPTLTPTATLTPTPRPSCTPRPPVTVTTQKGAPGTLQATVRVTRSAAAPNNTIHQIQFGAAPHAVVEINGQSRQGGSFTATVPTGQQQVTFLVRRWPLDAPSVTVPFTVIDDCDGWQSLVGGGPGSF
jgi:parallel beta-helix repeat protein